MKQITIFGNCTKDAELRTTQGGQKVCGFTVAVNDRRTKEALFFEVAYWGKPGEAVAQYISKGQRRCERRTVYARIQREDVHANQR